MSETSPQKTVLIVDDEQGLTDLYAAWLEDDYDVRTAYDGEQALDQIDGSVNIVLLDRRMPGLSGDEVLAKFRERGYECPVAMVTAVDPDIDLVDLNVDDYVTKPVDQDDLKNVIETLLQRATYSEEIRQYTALLSKKMILEQELNDGVLETSEEYSKLQSEVDEVRTAADDSLMKLLDAGQIEAVFRDLDPGDAL